MSNVVYVSHAEIERVAGPVRIARIQGEPQPVVFSVHGGIAAHYGRKPEDVGEPHAATLDYVVASAGG
jgi:hypothetical protein